MQLFKPLFSLILLASGTVMKNVVYPICFLPCSEMFFQLQVLTFSLLPLHMFLYGLPLNDACSLLLLFCVFYMLALPLANVNSMVNQYISVTKPNFNFLMQLARDAKCSGTRRCINGNAWCCGSTEARGSYFVFCPI